MAIVPVVESKELTHAIVREALVRLKAEVTVCVGEGYWMMVKPGESMPVNGVKNDPRHVEKVFVMLESKNMNMVRIWDIVADNVAKRYLVRSQGDDTPQLLRTRWAGDWFRTCVGKA